MQADGHVLFLKCLILLLLSSASEFRVQLKLNQLLHSPVHADLQKCTKSRQSGFPMSKARGWSENRTWKNPEVVLRGEDINYRWVLHFAEGVAVLSVTEVEHGALGEARMDPSSKGAAKRSDRGVTRGGTDEQLLHKITCLCWGRGFQIPQNNSQGQGSFWLVLGGSSDICGSPFWQTTGKVSSETQVTECTSLLGCSRYVFS